jgi:hypothetical protein
MSLTGGASWQSLDPPASYRFAQCNTCKAGTPAEQCRLHLHGPTSWFAPEGGVWWAVVACGARLDAS